MDQEQEQTPDAPQSDVQPAVDAPQPTEVSESVGTYETPAESTSQPESMPVNPFAAPEVSEPVTAPVVTEPTSVPSPFAAAPQVEEVPVFSTASAPTPVVQKSYKGVITVLVIVLVLALAAAIYSFYTHL